LNLTFLSLGEGPLVSDTPSDFEGGDGVLGAGEVVCGACTSASGGGGGASVGMGGRTSSTKDGFTLCGADSGSAMVRRILKYRCVWELW